MHWHPAPQYARSRRGRGPITGSRQHPIGIWKLFPYNWLTLPSGLAIMRGWGEAEPLPPITFLSASRNQPRGSQDVWLLALMRAEGHGSILSPSPTVRHGWGVITPGWSQDPHAGLDTSSKMLHTLHAQPCSSRAPSLPFAPSSNTPTPPRGTHPPLPQLTSLLTTLVTSSTYFSVPPSEPASLSKKPKLFSSGGGWGGERGEAMEERQDGYSTCGLCSPE